MVTQISTIDTATKPHGGFRQPTSKQLDSIRTAMYVFVEDDVARGVSSGAPRHCEACCDVRPTAGFIAYGAHQVCNGCATAYEVARVCGIVATIERFIQEPRIRTIALGMMATPHQVSSAA